MRQRFVPNNVSPHKVRPDREYVSPHRSSVIPVYRIAQQDVYIDAVWIIPSGNGVSVAGVIQKQPSGPPLPQRRGLYRQLLVRACLHHCRMSVLQGQIVGLRQG
jgi:hypothetical protein